VYSRVHHAIVDGISGVGLLRVLLDEAPTAQARPDASERSWIPAQLPAATELVRHALSG
jgi:hypothetical protein